MNTYKKSGGGE
jgi:hypothetical protein